MRAHPAAVDGDIAGRRRDLVQAMLAHAPFDGWTRTALVRAGEDLGLDSVDVDNAFPGGPAEVLELFSIEADHAMLAALEADDLAAMGVRQRVALAVRTRLEQNARHREAIRRMLAFLALPQNAGLAMRLLYRSVDATWAAAGDSALDYNFYTKRGLLAGVYASTLLYWLEDRSENHEATWDFLARRIEDVVRAGGRLAAGLSRAGELRERARRLRPELPRRGPAGRL